jgi:hypothetical protein
MHDASFLLTLVVCASSLCIGQAKTVFSGLPSTKLSEAGLDRVVQRLERKDAANLACIVSEIDGKYYWATRENKQLVRTESGAFITFVAVNGSGYVRFINPKMKQAAALMSETEAKYDYVEHLVIGLGSVTYWGVSQ